jgi:hypothetical protein
LTARVIERYRVSQRRKLLLFPLLSEALKLFEIKVSAQEEKEEKELVSNVAAHVTSVPPGADIKTWIDHLNDAFKNTISGQVPSKGYPSELFAALATQLPKTTKE